MSLSSEGCLAYSSGRLPAGMNTTLFMQDNVATKHAPRHSMLMTYSLCICMDSHPAVRLRSRLPWLSSRASATYRHEALQPCP